MLATLPRNDEATEAKALAATIAAAHRDIEHDIARLVADVRARPRHNEHLAELRFLVTMAEQVREVLKLATARIVAAPSSITEN